MRRAMPRIYPLSNTRNLNFINYESSMISHKKPDLIDKVIDFIDRQSVPSKLIRVLDHLERSSISAWICVNGYSQETQPPRLKLLINFILCFSCYLSALRFAIIAFSSNENLRIILGDTFIGYSAHTLMNVIFGGANLLLASIKTALALSEAQSRMVILKVFADLRTTQFDRTKFGLTKKDDLRFRRLTFLIGYSLDAFIVLACGSSLAMQFQAMVLNQVLYGINWRTIGFQLLWIPYVNVTYYFAGLAAYWFFIHTIIFISLSIHSSNSAIIRVNQLVKSARQFNEPTNYTRRYILQLFELQNAHYNTIAVLNDNLGLAIFISFFMGSFFADLAFFCGTYVSTKNILLDLLLSFIGFITLATITQYNLFAAGSFKKIEKFRKSLHKLSLGSPFDLKTRIKSITTLERMSTAPIGFYVGNILCIDDWSCILFLLENISLYLLLIANISKS